MAIARRCYVGTAVLGIGVAFNYPALFLFVMAATEAHERRHSVASFGFFFDIAGAVGAPLLGLVGLRFLLAGGPIETSSA